MKQMLLKNWIFGRKSKIKLKLTNWFKIIGCSLFLLFSYENINFNYKSFIATSENSIKLVTIADSQLIGNEFSYNILNRLAKWDSDRYMRLAYGYTIYNINPDLVIFLGDILDQGSIANDSDYGYFVKRFHFIFPIFGTEDHLYIDGDNDILESKESEKYANLKRFQQSFMNYKAFKFNSSISFKILNILEFQDLYSKYQSGGLDEHTKLPNKLPISTLCSHMTLFLQNQLFIQKIMEIYSPQLILSGDGHTSKIVRRELISGRNGIFVQKYETSEPFYFHLKLNQTSTYELSLPSINYRMGYRKTGIGVLELEMEDAWTYNAKYQVVWLPYRFWQLFLYAFHLIVVTLYCLIRY